MIVAGEASGDLHGGNLVRAMRRIDPGLSFYGVGGKRMQSAGVELLAEATAAKINERLAADLAARLRLDVLAGDDLLLSRAEAARFVGRSVKTLELWAAQDVGPKVTRTGPRSVAYRVGDLRDFARETSAAAASPAHRFVSEAPKTPV